MKTSRVQFRIDEELKSTFQALADSRGGTTEVLTDYIRRFVAKAKKQQVKDDRADQQPG